MPQPYAYPYAARSIIKTRQVLFQLIGADMNVLTDQPFVQYQPFSTYLLEDIICTNASVDLTAADGGIYTAASKGGTAIVANTQVYTALTAANKVLALTIAARESNALDLYLSLTGAQGAAATADFYVLGTPLS